MKRGEIRTFKFNQPDKQRPVLILTRNSIIDYLSEVTVAPITSTIRDIPTEVYLTKDDGMDKNCCVNFDHIQTVPKSKIGKLKTTLKEFRFKEVKRALLFALGF